MQELSRPVARWPAGRSMEGRPPHRRPERGSERGPERRKNRKKRGPLTPRKPPRLQHCPPRAWNEH